MTERTDRELLELAAKAAIAIGAPLTFVINTGLPFNNERWEYWNPLKNKRQCKHLARNLGIKETDQRAIVRAAASIGEQMK